MNIKFDYPLPLADGLQATEADVPTLGLFEDHLEVNTTPSILGNFLFMFNGEQGGDGSFTKEETADMQRIFGVILEKTKLAAEARYPKA